MGKGERWNGDKENKNKKIMIKTQKEFTLYVNKKTDIYCRTNNTDQSLQRKETLK